MEVQQAQTQIYWDNARKGPTSTAQADLENNMELQILFPLKF